MADKRIMLLGVFAPHARLRPDGRMAEQVKEPVIFFRLWNGTDPDAESTWPPIYGEPVLLAVRCGTGPFRDAFTFTREGKKRRPDTE